jgi:SAM-dependent methyltransferase
MREVNLLDRYPRSKRDIASRAAAAPTERAVAKQFGPEYFDGDRGQGYGGYCYDGRWVRVAERFRDFYDLRAEHRVLEIGCAKGFFLHDLRGVVPGIRLTGVDVSKYAIDHAMDDVKPCLVLASADSLPFPDRFFDLVISINVVHNLELEGCMRAIREMERVSVRHKYLQVDSWLDEEQKEKFLRWQLTALTFFDPEGWRRVFAEASYTGDYFWTLTE